MIAGAESWVDMALYGQNKADWLSPTWRWPSTSPPLAGPGADDMQRALIAATVEGTAHRLAINGDDLSIHANGKGLRPGCETTLKILWVDQHEDTAEGVMGRNAVR